MAGLLEDRRHALGREHARRHDTEPPQLYLLERFEQLPSIPLEGAVLRVVEAPAVAEFPEARRRLDAIAGRVANAIGDDERVAGVLVQHLVRPGVQRVGLRIPDDLVDADDLPAVTALGVAEADEEDGATAHRRDVDPASEWDRQPRLDVESVERVDHVDVRAV